ncbi:MAG: hypothetical protein U0165_15505 [Polyangiaceae bacterium]
MLTRSNASRAWKDPSRVLRWAAAFSMLVHIPFFTTEWTREFFGGLYKPGFRLEDLEGSAEIPFEVELVDSPTTLARSSGDDRAPVAAGTTGLVEEKLLKDPNAADAGSDASFADAAVDGGKHASDAGSDAGRDRLDAGREASAPTPLGDLDGGADAAADAEAGVGGKAIGDAGLGEHDGGESDGGAAPVREVKDPVSMVGNTSSITGGNPNVSLLFNMDVVRANAPTLATQLGPAISQMKQWNAFFGGTSLDPVKDTERILIAGPQMRKTDQIVSVVQLKGDAKRTREAVDALIKNAGGTWESQSPPIAKAKIDNAERNFLLPGNNVVLVVPPSLLDKAKKISNPAFPKPNGEALVVKVRDPARAFKGLPFTMPSTIQWVRISLMLRSDGSGEVVIKLDDADAATAVASAKTLSDGIEAVRVKTVLGMKMSLFAPVTFRTSGATVIGTTTLTATELRSLGEIVPAGLMDLGK